MRTVNRSAFVVRPREPYLRWAAGIDDDPADAMETLRRHVSIYLVAEDPRGEAETAPLADYCEEIFEMELEAWSLDEGRWPETRDLVTFVQWFDVTGESIVVDLETTRLRAEAL